MVTVFKSPLLEVVDIRLFSVIDGLAAGLSPCNSVIEILFGSSTTKPNPNGIYCYLYEKPTFNARISIEGPRLLAIAL